MRRFWLATLCVVAGVAAPLLVLEIALRFLPVDRGLHSLPVNASNPVHRFTPTRTTTFSRSWNFTQANVVHSNNYGFINDQDYDPAATTPLLAVVGDSYVEAVMVPYHQTGAAILAADLGAKGRVYTFGTSSSPLSQYLVYADYARQTFRPSGLVVVVIANDFDESLLKYKKMPGFHYFKEGAGGQLELHRVDYALPLSTRLVRESALGMYLLLNLRATTHLDRWRGRPRTAFSAATPATADATRVADSKRGVDAFLRLLPAMSGLGPTDILFAVDGIRPAIYQSIDEASVSPYADQMRRYFMAQARSHGFEVIDMHDEFGDHYRQHRQRFDYEDDAHWNAVGHGVFAAAVKRSSLYGRISK